MSQCFPCPPGPQSRPFGFGPQSDPSSSARRRQIAASLQDKESRDLFVSEEIDTGLSFQILAMRLARHWSQQELGRRIGMTQEGVSRLENPDYGKFSLSTLKRLASAFDVALMVRFAPFSQIVDWTVELSPEDITVPGFDDDSGLESVSNPVENRLMAQSV